MDQTLRSSDQWRSGSLLNGKRGEGKSREEEERERKLKWKMNGWWMLIKYKLTAHGVVLQTISVTAEIRGQDPATPYIFLLISISILLIFWIPYLVPVLSPVSTVKFDLSTQVRAPTDSSCCLYFADWNFVFLAVCLYTENRMNFLWSRVS